MVRRQENGKETEREGGKRGRIRAKDGAMLVKIY